MPYGRFRGMKPDFPQHNKTCVWRKQQHFLFRDSKDFASNTHPFLRSVFAAHPCTLNVFLCDSDNTDFYFSPSACNNRNLWSLSLLSLLYLVLSVPFWAGTLKRLTLYFPRLETVGFGGCR